MTLLSLWSCPAPQVTRDTGASHQLSFNWGSVGTSALGVDAMYAFEGEDCFGILTTSWDGDGGRMQYCFLSPSSFYQSVH